MDSVKTTYQVTIYSDGRLFKREQFDELWEAAEWMENHAASGQMWFSGMLCEMIDNNENTMQIIYGF